VGLAKLLKSVDALLLYVERSIPMRDRLFSGRPSEVHRLEAPYLSIRALP